MVDARARFLARLAGVEDPEQKHHKVHFDNLTPLYPDEKIKLVFEETPEEAPVA